MQKKMQEEEEARVKRMQLRFKAPSELTCELTQDLEGWWDTSMNGAKRLCHNI